MVIRIPGPGEPGSFGPPLAQPDRDPGGAVSEKTRSALGRMQARDDALFVAGATADLVARRNQAVHQAETAAFGHNDALERVADGFAAGLADGFDADVESIAAEAASLNGPRPSDQALDLFRRKALALKPPFTARAAVMEDALRRQGQQERIARAIAAMGAMVRDDPDTLDQASARIDDLAAAAGALAGHPAAAELKDRALRDLQESAIRGLIVRDPARALAALRDGARDSALDDGARARLEAAARDRAESLGQDSERAQTIAARAAERQQASQAASFLTGFERRLADGRANLAEIADAEADGIVSAAQAGRLRSRLRDHDAAEAGRQSLLQRAVGRLDRGMTLDPADPDDRAAAELWFESIAGPALKDAPAADTAEAITLLGGQLGMLPDGAAKRLRGLLIAAPPDGQVAAARAVKGLQAIAPDLLGDLPPGERRRALRLCELDGLGVPAAEAVHLADTAPPGSLHADAVSAAEADGANAPPRASDGEWAASVALDRRPDPAATA